MNHVAIKICGITNADDALAAIEMGAEMLGLNFYPGSPRCLKPAQAQQIAAAVGTRARVVGVFVNMPSAEILQIARAVPLAAVQLHGDESAETVQELGDEFEVIRVCKMSNGFAASELAAYAGSDNLLLDTPSPCYGGSGVTFNWEGVNWKALRTALPHARLFLAGGLHAGNVARAIALAQPDVVDVCSGVEQTRGVKSMMKMHEFAAAVRAAEGQEP
jgi:phosphoribosylanthranilate isomerase